MDSNNNKITNDTNIQSNKSKKYYKLQSALLTCIIIDDPYIKFDMNEIPQSEKAELSDSDKTKKEENGKEEVAGCLCCVA
jgi:hypothetical protein